MEQHYTWKENGCPICESTNTETFLTLKDMPVQDGVVYESEEEAKKSPVGDINLAVCYNCLYIGNETYDASKIFFTEYNYSQHHSPLYQKYISELITNLINSFSLRQKDIVDVGCGKGYFMYNLCIEGDNKGHGIDPSYEITEEVPTDLEGINFIKDFYSDKYKNIKGDFVSCRHVVDELEHPKPFVQIMRPALKENKESLIFLELPNGQTTFEKELFWNIGYAKRSWFTPASLATFLQHCGYKVARVMPLFYDQYLGIAGHLDFSGSTVPAVSDDQATDMRNKLKNFAENYKSEIQKWENRLTEMEAANEQIVIWGAGMRGLNFLNRFANKKVMPAIVDINPNRQGKFLPGSGYRIDPIESLKEVQPDKILLSNPNYEKEIKVQAMEMGLNCEFYNL